MFCNYSTLLCLTLSVPLLTSSRDRDLGFGKRVVVIRGNTRYRLGIMSSDEKTISFRAVAEKIAALDSLAAAQDRSRSYLINEAITNYIELHAYQEALVRQGQAELRKGRVIDHEEVVSRLKKTGRASR